jgi:hypothetical protein
MNILIHIQTDISQSKPTVLEFHSLFDQTVVRLMRWLFNLRRRNQVKTITVTNDTGKQHRNFRLQVKRLGTFIKGNQTELFSRAGSGFILSG